MGRPKHLLPFGNECVLQRVVRIVSDVVDTVAVVHGIDQSLPVLPNSIQTIQDLNEHRGPLAGIARGLALLPVDVEAVYISGCDTPLLCPEFIQAMINHLGNADCAVPLEERFLHPLASVYRKHLAEHAQQLIDSDQLRPRCLIEKVNHNLIPVDTLRAVDPELNSLQNMNDEQAYQQLLSYAQKTGLL